MSSESKKLSKRISKVEAVTREIKSDIAEIKKLLKADSKESKSPKPSKIENSQNIMELKKFTVSQLKEYIKKKKIDVKKVSDKHKEDFVKIVWKHIKNSSDSDSESESSGSDSESESESSDSGDESD